jgi:hypothetical protein
LGWYLHQGFASDLWRRASFAASAAAVVILVGGTGISLVAAGLQVIAIPTGFVLAGVALGTLAFAVLGGQKIAWRHSAGIVFLALVLGVQYLLPAYNDLFSLRKQLRDAASPTGRGVVCYPQRYESASFYLPQREVHVFGVEQRQQLFAHLDQHPGTLLLVKSGPVLERLLAELPPGVEFQTRQRRAAILVGRIVRRGDDTERLLAREE